MGYKVQNYLEYSGIEYYTEWLQSYNKRTIYYEIYIKLFSEKLSPDEINVFGT